VLSGLFHLSEQNVALSNSVFVYSEAKKSTFSSRLYYHFTDNSFVVEPVHAQTRKFCGS